MEFTLNEELHERVCRHRLGRFPAGSIGFIVSDDKVYFLASKPQNFGSDCSQHWQKPPQIDLSNVSEQYYF